MPKNVALSKTASFKRKSADLNSDFNNTSITYSAPSLAEQAINHLAKLRKLQESLTEEHELSYQGNDNKSQSSSSKITTETSSSVKSKQNLNSRLETPNSHFRIHTKRTPNETTRRIKTEVNDVPISIKQEMVNDFIASKNIKREITNDVNDRYDTILISDSEDEQINVKQEKLSDTEKSTKVRVKKEIVNHKTNVKQVQVKQEIEVSSSSDDECFFGVVNDEIWISDSETELHTYVKREITSDNELDETYNGGSFKPNTATNDRSTQKRTKSKPTIAKSVTETEAKINENYGFKGLSDNVNTVENAARSSSSIYKEKSEENKNSSVESHTDQKPQDIYDQGKTIAIRNLPETVRKADLQNFFERYGKVEKVDLNIKTCRTPSAKYPVIVNSFIRYEKSEDALKALEVNGMEYRKHHLKVDISKCKKQYYPDKTIFIRNIPYNAEDDDLWNVFEACGPIQSVNLIRHQASRKVIGIGFIVYELSESVELALKMKSVKIGKKTVYISKFIPKETNQSNKNSESEPKINSRSRKCK